MNVVGRWTKCDPRRVKAIFRDAMKEPYDKQKSVLLAQWSALASDDERKFFCLSLLGAWREVPDGWLRSTLAQRAFARSYSFAEQELSVLIAPLYAFSKTKDAYWCNYPLLQLAGFLSRYKTEHGAFPRRIQNDIEGFFKTLHNRITDNGAYPLAKCSHEARKILARYQELSGQVSDEFFSQGEIDRCTKALLQCVLRFPEQSQNYWKALVKLCKETNTKPTKTWLSKIRSVLAESPFFSGEYERVMDAIREMYLQKREYTDAEKNTMRRNYAQSNYNRELFDSEDAYIDYEMRSNPYEQVSLFALEVMQKLAWAGSLLDSDGVAERLYAWANAAYEKLPGTGVRHCALGNSCVWSLEQLDSSRGVPLLVRLAQKKINRTVQKTIQQSLQRKARAMGISQDELEDSMLPTYGFDQSGIYHLALDGYAGTLTLSGASVAVEWSDPDGKRVKAPPRSIVQAHRDEVKTFSSLKKTAELTLARLAQRLERTYVSRQSWTHTAWKKLFEKHPFFHTFAESLIWIIDDAHGAAQAVMYRDGRFADRQRQTVEAAGEESHIALWHPMNSSAEEVLSWRKFVVTNQICQPIRQAFREVYLLSDDEKKTEMYSNRFAGNVIRQHQFNSLCQSRGWMFRMQSTGWDGADDPAYCDYPDWDIRVEFLVSPLDGSAASGISLNLSTDQVRFFTLGTRQMVPLRNVPQLVFSEVMRDVDLFTSVPNVGLDPEWADKGVDAWTRYAFGHLTERGKMRKTALEFIVPRIWCASQCGIEEEYVTVRGRRATYLVHIGSSQVRVHPSGTPLCIVRGASSFNSTKDDLYLPFEGDSILSEILSKIFLLADDATITDETILRQIHHATKL